MFKKITILIFVFINLSLFSGCWDSLDINRKEILITATMDKIDGEYYYVSELANYARKKSDGGSDQENFTIHIAHAETFVAARNALDNSLEKPIFLSTMSVLVFTERLAKDGIQEYMYRFRSLGEYRKTLNIVTTSTELTELLSTHAASSASAGGTIEQMLVTHQKRGTVVTNTGSEILENLSQRHTCFLLPSINLIEENIALTGYSVIEDGIYTATIPIEQTKGINYILNKKVKYDYSVPFNENTAVVEVTLKKRKCKPSYKNDNITFDMTFSFDAKVKYLNLNDGLTEAITIQVEENLKKLIEEDLQIAIDMSLNELKSDYLQFDEIFRINYPNEYKNMDWYEKYLTSTINLNVNLTLSKGGKFGNLDYNPNEE